MASAITDTMITTLKPEQARELIARGDLDVVDVRNARDWSNGHIPEARSVPLEALQGDPRGALPRDGVIFVCAKGVRSRAAAKLAEAIGLHRLFDVDGGTLAWAGAGLPLVRG